MLSKDLFLRWIVGSVDVPDPAVPLAEARPVAALASDHPPDVPDVVVVVVEGIVNPVDAEVEEAVNPVEALLPVAEGMDHPEAALVVDPVLLVDEPLGVEPEADVLPKEVKLNVLPLVAPVEDVVEELEVVAPPDNEVNENPPLVAPVLGVDAEVEAPPLLVEAPAPPVKLNPVAAAVEPLVPVKLKPVVAGVLPLVDAPLTEAPVAKENPGVAVVPAPPDLVPKPNPVEPVAPAPPVVEPTLVVVPPPNANPEEGVPLAPPPEGD